jgi:hypothetical protein
VVVLAALALMGGTARATVSTVINYQGLLRDSGGAPVTGATDFSFAIFADSSGGVALWTEAHPGTAVSGGIFSAHLGAVTPFPPTLFSGASLWLQTSVSGSPLAPRSLLGASPYAFHAALADAVVGGGGQDSLWTASGGSVYRLGGTVGIGIAPASGVKLYVATNGSSQFSLKLEHFGSNLIVRPLAAGSTSTVIENTGTGNLLLEPNSGLVGIGTSAPTQVLDVAGKVRARFGIVFGDGTTQTTAQLVGPTGPQGPAGPTGPAVTTFAVCSSATSCSFKCGFVLGSTPAPCEVTSDTGGCSWGALVGELGPGTCCVCKP